LQTQRENTVRPGAMSRLGDIEGKVKNVGEKFKQNVQVEARVWNQNKNVVGTARVETKPKDLKPGGTSSFAFRIAAKDGTGLASRLTKHSSLKFSGSPQTIVDKTVEASGYEFPSLLHFPPGYDSGGQEKARATEIVDHRDCLAAVIDPHIVLYPKASLLSLSVIFIIRAK